MTLLTIENKKLQIKCDGCQIVYEKPNWTHIRNSKMHFHSSDCHNKWQKISNPKRNKICAYCGIAFFDDSKRPDVGTTCSKKHAYALMSKTRHEKKSYIRTSEQIQKGIETVRRKYGSYSALQTEESRIKCSKKLKEHWASGEMIIKIRKTTFERYGVEHWSKSEFGRQFVSQLHLNRKLSLETRHKMSVSATKRIMLKNKTYTSGNGGFRQDLNCYFRSNWEANYARVLQFEGKNWQYETESFQLNDGTIYIPDFKIDGEAGFIEIKGRINDADSMKKLEAFLKEYPKIPIKLIGPYEYDSLRKQYKKLVAWEGK